MVRLIGVETSVPEGNLLVVKGSLESGTAFAGRVSSIGATAHH